MDQAKDIQRSYESLMAAMAEYQGRQVNIEK